MNVTATEKPGKVMVLTATVTEADYAPEVDKSLREYRRKANVPGFRPGMVPMSIINKMYRKGAVAEQAYRKANEAVFKHLEDSKIDIMGDVMPSDDQPELDFDGATEHLFMFEVGVAPKVDVTVGADDKLTLNKIKPSKEMREGYRSNFLRRFSSLKDVDKVTKDEALEVSLDGGDVHVDEAYVGLISMSDDERKPFVGKKVGDAIKVDVRKLYKDPKQLTAVMGIEEEQIESLAPEFTATVKRIRQFAEPALDGEFFKLAFPDGSVADAAAFEKYIDDAITADLARESGYLFSADLKKHLMAKANLSLPEEFLKKWLYAVNEGKFSMEEIEKDFAAFLQMMSWNLIMRHFADTMDIRVEQDDLMKEAKAIARMQFAQYGMSQVPDETLEGYAKSILGNKEEAQRIFEQVRERKILAALTPLVKTTEKSVSLEEFQKLAAAAQA
ncbi:MAG: trigger factor [Alistipes sp.]|jgi:trigger factor|nr:trigger factor [Alistipes sp.]